VEGALIDITIWKSGGSDFLTEDPSPQKERSILAGDLGRSADGKLEQNIFSVFSSTRAGLSAASKKGPPLAFGICSMVSGSGGPTRRERVITPKPHFVKRPISRFCITSFVAEKGRK
jgi:hypothetical protein